MQKQVRSGDGVTGDVRKERRESTAEEGAADILTQLSGLKVADFSFKMSLIPGAKPACYRRGGSVLQPSGLRGACRRLLGWLGFWQWFPRQRLRARSRVIGK